MKKMTITSLALTAVACLAVGCGGGGAAPLSTLPQADGFATLKALVVENDGLTTGLDGHAFTFVQTGETAVSTTDGSLAFGPASSSSFTLRLTNADPLGPEDQPSGEGEYYDPTDDERADRSEVHVEQVQANEQIEVRIHLRDGEMNCVHVCRQWRNERDVEIEMQRTDTNDDPDMEGELEVESDVDRQSFEVRVGHADAGRDLELVVIDTEGTEESQGLRNVDALGEAEWSMDTGDGDRLPFAVTDVEELEGYDIEVRDGIGGDVLLTATVPEMAPHAEKRDRARNRDGDTDGEGPGDGDGNGDGDTEPLSGRAPLTAVEAGLEGYVEIRSREDGDCESFHMEVEGLTTGRTVEFFVEDPDAAGSFLSLGTRTAHGSRGTAHLGLSTTQGDELPGGVESVADLVGLDVEVRAPDSAVLLLYGTIPELTAD